MHQDVKIQGTELVDTDTPETIGAFNSLTAWHDTYVENTFTEDAEWEDVIEEENEADKEDLIELQELNKYQDVASSCAFLSSHSAC
jgi:hypothetical protein